MNEHPYELNFSMNLTYKIKFIDKSDKRQFA